MKRPFLQGSGDPHGSKQPRLGGMPGGPGYAGQGQQFHSVPQHLGHSPQGQLQQQGGPAGQQGSLKEVYTVYTTGTDKDEVVIRTLVGEYTEKGMNHGRKVYQKRPEISSGDNVEVLIYYWDNRDGPAFEGWWFGNKLGGTQVWSHCKDSGLMPPGAGWKIPWDGAVRQTLVVINKEAQMKAEMNQKVGQLRSEVAKVEAECNEALDRARAAVDEGTSSEGFTEAEQLLLPRVRSADALGKKIAELQKNALASSSESFQALSDAFKKLHTSITEECASMKTKRESAEQAAKDRDAEERDGAVLNEYLPEAIEKTNTAEDMVEKAVITSEMVSMCGDEASVVMKAIEETEVSTKKAQGAIGEARIFLNAKLASTRRFTEKIKETASAELGKLMQQLQEAHNKLAPLKTIRADHEAKRLAAKLISEVEEKMALAEVAVDRSEESVMLVGSAPPTKEGLTEAQQALKGAEEQVQQAVRFLETKKQGATGLALEEVQKFEPRGEEAKARIARLRTSLKEANERVTSDGYIAESLDKVQAVTDAMNKLEEADESSQDIDANAAAAQTAASMARMFIQMKVLEVKRFSGGPGSEATKKLQECQAQIQTATTRITELKSSAGKRKRLALVKESEKEVKRAEELCASVVECAKVFADDGKLMELSSEQVNEASEKFNAADKEAAEALKEVRKMLTQRQLEAKGRDSVVEVSAELIKFQTRLGAAQQELAKQKKLFSSVEQRVAAKKIFDEAEKRMVAAEEKVTKVAEAHAALGEVTTENTSEDAPGSPKATKQVDVLMQEASGALRSTVAYLKTQGNQSRATEFVKECLAKMEPRTKAAQERLDCMQVSLRERSDKLMTVGIITEAQQKKNDCLALVNRVIETEASFRNEQGVIAIPENGKTLLVDLEKAIQSAHSTASGTKTFISMQRLNVRRLQESSMMKSTSETLDTIQATVEENMKKLSEMRTKCTEIKKVLLKKVPGK